MKAFRISALTLAATLVGCSTVAPTAYPTEKATTPVAVAERMSQEWNEAASVKEGRQATVLLTPMGVPRHIRSKPISLELEAGANVTDLVAALARLGHSVILADKEAGAKTFYLPRYEGNIGGLLNSISRVSDVWFTWHEGAIVVSSKERVSISLPQDQGLAAVLEKELKGFSIEGATVSSSAGMLSMELSPSQLRKVKSYLERVTSNAAVVTLQLAIVNVQLKQDAKQGIDWTGLGLAIGKDAKYALTDPLFKSAIDTATGYTDGTYSTQPDPGTDPTPLRLVETATGMLMKNGALQGLITAGNFSFGAMFNFLDQYGTTETKQNTIFKTVTGQEVVFKQLTEVPFISEIGAVASTNTTQSSVKTDKAKDGLELSLTPTFDAAANTISIKLKMSLKAVLGFNELSAGNQVGKISQPTTSDQSFNDEIRLRPGQTAVVGGIMFDNIADKRALPLFLQRGSSMESQQLVVNRQAMFIVVRPAVTRMGDLASTEADTLDLAPDAVVQLAQQAAAKQVKTRAVAPKAKSPKNEAAAPAAPAAPVAPPQAPASQSNDAEYQQLELKEEAE